MLATALTVGAAETNIRKHSCASAHKYSMESEARIEAWMLNSLMWNCGETLFYRNAELSLPLEGWMTSPVNWDMAVIAAVDHDDPMELEEWMTSRVWNRSTIDLPESEDALSLEPWMTSNEYWNQPVLR